MIELLLEKGSLLVPVKEENREVWGEGSWRIGRVRRGRRLSRWEEEEESVRRADVCLRVRSAEDGGRRADGTGGLVDGECGPGPWLHSDKRCNHRLEDRVRLVRGRLIN